MEARRDTLRFRRLRQQISSNLLERELVKRHVCIQRRDDPIAVGPYISKVIALKPMRICVAGQIQPRTSPPLPKLRSRQKLVNESLIMGR